MKHYEVLPIKNWPEPENAEIFAWSQIWQTSVFLLLGSSTRWDKVSFRFFWRPVYVACWWLDRSIKSENSHSA
jgi:hypothetical protein